MMLAGKKRDSFIGPVPRNSLPLTGLEIFNPLFDGIVFALQNQALALNPSGLLMCNDDDRIGTVNVLDCWIR